MIQHRVPYAFFKRVIRGGMSPIFTYIVDYVSFVLDRIIFRGNIHNEKTAFPT